MLGNGAPATTSGILGPGRATLQPLLQYYSLSLSPGPVCIYFVFGTWPYINHETTDGPLVL